MRRIVITGGSRGIGAEAVRRFAALGDDVTFLYARSHDAAQALARQTGATAICCDVAEPEQVAAAFSQIGPVDVLILNAAVAHQGLVTDIGEAATTVRPADRNSVSTARPSAPAAPVTTTSPFAALVMGRNPRRGRPPAARSRPPCPPAPPRRR